MKCKECGRDCGLGGRRGRLPRYCSNACRQRAYRHRRSAAGAPTAARDAALIPAAMLALPRWTRAQGKRPMQADGRAASSTRSETWASYALIRAAQAGDGYGIMLGAGLACIDLDDALDAQGAPTETARRVLETFPGAWVEVSLSGHGLHLFGTSPEQPGRRFIARDGTGVEFYSRDRFIRITERVFRPGALPALDLDALVAALA